MTVLTSTRTLTLAFATEDVPRLLALEAPHALIERGRHDPMKPVAEDAQEKQEPEQLAVCEACDHTGYFPFLPHFVPW
jgi:hypothetical protein